MPCCIMYALLLELRQIDEARLLDLIGILRLDDLPLGALSK